MAVLPLESGMTAIAGSTPTSVPVPRSSFENETHEII
jgi:hypothetical protein